MQTERKVVCTVTKEELEEIKTIGVCQTACQRVVKEVIKEWEKAELITSAWWDATRQKYNLDVDNDEKVYSINHVTGVVTETEKTQVGEWMRYREEKEGFRERMKRIFHLKD